MKNTDALVSLLIVTWNRREDVGKAIASALAQTYAPLEVVVVDNASDDGTYEMVASVFPEVRLVRTDKNLGCPSGRNAGFVHCGGKYIYCLDDDGWLDSRAIERCVSTAEGDPRIGVVMSDIRTVDENSRDDSRSPTEGRGLLPRQVAAFSGGCSLISAEALSVVGVFPDDFFRQAEESDLALRLLDKGYLCVSEPRSIMFHKPSSIGRCERGFLYYQLRNTNKTALRLYPMPYAIAKCLMQLWHSLVYALKLRYPLLPFLILRDMIREFRSLTSQRNPVSYAAIRMYLRLNGRQKPDQKDAQHKV